MSEEKLHQTNNSNRENQGIEQSFHREVLQKLWEMVKVLKQEDRPEYRSQLQEYCQDLAKMGKEANLSLSWLELLETAEQALVDENNTYRTSGKQIIKEIKQAADLVLAGRSEEITVSDKLKELAHIESNAIATDLPEIENSDPAKGDDEAILDLGGEDWQQLESSSTNSEEVLDLGGEDWTKSESSSANGESLLDEEILDLDGEDWTRSESSSANGESLLDEEILDLGGEDWTKSESSSANGESLLDEEILDLGGEDWIGSEKSSANGEEAILDLDGEDWSEAGEENNLDLLGNITDTPEIHEDDPTKDLFSLLDLPTSEVSEELSDKVSDDLWGTIEEDHSDREKEQEKIGAVLATESEIDEELDLETLATGTDLCDTDLEEISTSSLEVNAVNELEELLEADRSAEKIAVGIATETNGVVKDNNFIPPSIYEQFEELDNLIEKSSAVVATEINGTVSFEELEVALGMMAAPEKIGNSYTVINNETTQIIGEDQNATEFLKETEQATTPSSIDREIETLTGQLQPKEKAKAKTSDRKQKAPKKALEQTMRVPVKQLDNLNNLIGELVVKRNSLEQDQERLHRFLDNLLNQVQSLSDVGGRMQELYERSLLEGALMNSRGSGGGGDNRSSSLGVNESSSSDMNEDDDDFDPFELDRFTDFHLLSQEMIELIVRVRESASDIQFLVDETEQVSRTLRQVSTQLQEGMTKCRMVPFSQTSERLPRAIRDISLKLSKQAKLEVEGKDVLIDKMILDSLYDPMTHLVNNAITHGIETPEERQKIGKNIQGKIQVKAYFQGNQTVISVADDGAGINPEKVKSKAIQKQLVDPVDAKHLSRQEIYEFLFHPGFSTRDKADDFAGRGVGMDVVRSKLNAIRGTISIDSTIGKGTNFTIRLPQTLSICKALLCINDRGLIAFPIDGVEDTQEFAPTDVRINSEGKKCVMWRDSLIPFQPLTNLLCFNRQISRGSVYGGKQNDDSVSIVVLRGAGKILAVQLDQVEGEQEIVIKQIQGPLPKPPGIAGATVLGDGRIMPIADVLELIEISQGIRSIDSASWGNTMLSRAAATLAAKKDPMVLIVDDSITVRELLSLSFSKVGYRVEQARDGQEAWEKLKSGLPCDLIFCDIEMPRMNGLELLSNIQKDEELNEVPVAMLTSRGAEKHQQLAAKLGASAYFIKPYTEKDLLDAAQRMLDGEILLANSSKAPKVSVSAGDNTISEEEVTQPKQPEKSRSRAKLDPRVLIVDDSVIVREMVSMTFSKAGYIVEQARDGQEAWEKIRSGLPCDLIVCDIEMPRMNGLEFLSHVQEDPNLAEVPVAMLTSRGAQKMKKIAAQRGAKAYFVKPYVEEVLIDSAKRLLNGEVLLENSNSDE
ncbi:MAG: response regulator [Prochloraceae cyanobacterium]|nr:response regulator [Prochloraceae cyanobacterium]